ncbi:hypothetical protein EWM64_g3971 [Hericium alpestre]|uniref:t-SNARE coiled-coil homology domain-containing protein n=1 Tax=Hericium alpestre TaxID=135208 RepID=A0A4Z0A1H4_9AGAM|nr:hypothetical protein EWM64_g3971 [Hericium alpestre]
MMDQDDFPPPPPPQEAPDVFAEPLPLPNFNHAAHLLNNLSHTHNLTSVVMGIMANLQQELSVSCQGLAAHMQHVPNIPAVANANQLAFIAQGIQGLNNRFDGLENRFTAVENRFTVLENRFTGLEEDLEQVIALGQQRHQEINQRLDQVITQENQRNQDINRRLDQMAAQVHDVDRRFDAVLERLDNVEGGLANATQRLTNVEGGLANVTQRLTNVEGGLANATQRLANVEGGLANANQQLTNVEGGLANANQQLTNATQRLTTANRKLTTLGDKLSWEHQTANTRLLNSMTPLGPYRVIPHKPDCHDYGRRDFPKDLSQVHEMSNVQCGRLATAWDIDLDHLNQLDNTEQLNARKRCVARFMGLNL